MNKSFEELCYNDDFMFGKIMEDPGICHDVLECLLNKSIGELTEVQTQKEFKYFSDGKPIKMDVYNQDSTDGSIYDTEMQNLNKKSIESHMLPHRTRFYQASIDSDFLAKGHSFKSLPESTIIFICTFDPFKAGFPVYTFGETCEEDPSLKLNDGTKKLFFNCGYKGDNISDDLRIYYEYVMTGVVGNDLTNRIDRAVEKGRMNEMWRSQFMKEMVLIQDAKDEGREEGRKEGRKEGRDTVNKLITILMSQNRLDDLKRAATDKEYQSMLINELIGESKNE